MSRTVLFIFGTRPEAIKMAPLIRGFKASEHRTVVAVTAQHREMLDQVLSLFQIVPDHDLNLMTSRQSLTAITTKALIRLQGVLEEERPDLVFVQGDTTTTFVGALAAFYERIPVGHVEAGLRTHDRYSPYPEEMNRTMTTALAQIHFPPTQGSRENLLRENVASDNIHVTGNTGIDALLEIASLDYQFAGDLERVFGERGTRKLLLTTHRRENYGAPLAEICQAALQLLGRFPDLEVIFPVHLSPVVKETAMRLLGSHPRVHLLEPLDYKAFVNAMKCAYLILTDSGGVQEEAPSLGKPVLVLRNTTERPEAVKSGTIRLVGTDSERIVSEASRLLTDKDAYDAMARTVNPYGDGQATQRILSIVDDFLGSGKIINRYC